MSLFSNMRPQNTFRKWRIITALRMCLRSRTTLWILVGFAVIQGLFVIFTAPPTRITVLTNDVSSTTGQCVDVNMAVTVSGIYQRRRLSILIKSILLNSRDAILHLHLLCDEVNRNRIETLLSTWNLTQVVPHYYTSDGLVQDFDSLVEIAGYFIRNDHLLKGNTKMILAKSDVYFISDVSFLWQKLEAILLDEMVAILEYRFGNPNDVTPNTVMLLDISQSRQVLHKLEPLCDGANLSFTKDYMSSFDSRALISTRCRLPSGKWKTDSKKQTYQIPVVRTQTILPFHLSNVSAKSVEYDMTYHIEQFDGDIFRQLRPMCLPREKPTPFRTSCDVYLAIASLPRRTHTYFAGGLRQETVPPKVTLVTQLMLNRIDHLERLLQAWDGPSQVALYLTDEESAAFADIYERSETLRRANAVYHVIFKRHKFYPINYLRNVAIRETTTPFYIMIDVDFAAQTTLYKSITSYLRQLKTEEKKAFVVPVFETFLKQYNLPTSKKQLVEDLDNKLLVPYHQFEGTWTKGHERTDYAKWRTSTATYQVEWEFGYEPYLVVPTSEFLYDETLVERMRDKLTYTVQVVLKGYTLHVLPFDYLIHTPHKKSSSYQYSDQSFLHCSTVVYNRRVKEMKLQYGRSSII